MSIEEVKKDRNMKSLISVLIGLVLVVGLSGCMSDKAYMTGKVIYKGAKTVYIELPVKSEKLELMDKVVVTYDKARTTVKDEIERQKSKKKLNADTSKVQVQ